MNDHHLILGKIKDIISGQMITDTHDERYRQKIAKILIEQKGYQRAEITPQYELVVRAGDKCARVPVTFVIDIEERTGIIVHYGPGSLVTRHRPALAISRVVAPYQVPIVVITNGEEADILEGRSGKIIGHGLTGIPHRDALLAETCLRNAPTISIPRAKREARIIMAYEVDDRCPCDDTTCLLQDR